MIKLIGKQSGESSFTKSQEECIEAISAFLKDDSKTIFTVEGAAGTGKTYMMRYVINTIIKSNICVTAPTHKALRVIEQHTGKKGRTLQSLHGLRPNVNLENFNIDKIQFEALGVPRINNYKVVICDECSMIGKDLFDLNNLRAAQYKIKLIYVGDSAQLSPVGERVSRTFLIEDKYTLTDVIRQQGDNPLLDVLCSLREDIDTNSTRTIKLLKSRVMSKLNDKGEGYVTLKGPEFNTQVIDLFKSEDFTNNLNHVRYIAWTNDNIKIWNKHIRSNIIPDCDSTFISVHDVFTGYRTIIDDYMKDIIVNSEDYIVDSIQPRIAEGGFKTYNVILTNVFTKMFTPVISIVNHDDPSFVQYYNKLNTLHFNAIYAKPSDKGRMWKAYYEFKDRFLCMVSFNLCNADGTSRGTVGKDIDYGFGITGHKSQGSTYTNVCVNLINMTHDKKGNAIGNHAGNPHAVEHMNKLLYVALSRATSKAIIHI